jgi:hypothetical protein
MPPRPDWSDPTTLDAFKGLFNCQDDNSYYAAVKGFSQYVANVQQRFEDLFTTGPLRIKNLTQDAADMYNSTGCYGAEAGPQCVLNQLTTLNPNLTQFQIYCINNCADPDLVQSGEWEQAGDAIRQSYKDLWERFVKAYAPPAPASVKA